METNSEMTNKNWIMKQSVWFVILFLFLLTISFIGFFIPNWCGCLDWRCYNWLGFIYPVTLLVIAFGAFIFIILWFRVSWEKYKFEKNIDIQKEKLSSDESKYNMAINDAKIRRISEQPFQEFIKIVELCKTKDIKTTDTKNDECKTTQTIKEEKEFIDVDKVLRLTDRFLEIKKQNII